MSDSTNNKVNGHIMSLQQLISAPLVATIDADAMSTERYMKHFMSLAFESYNPADGSTGALRLISFNFTDSDASGGAEKKVSVPLISLVTLPLLQIKQADFDFDINIIDAVAPEPDLQLSLYPALHSFTVCTVYFSVTAFTDYQCFPVNLFHKSCPRLTFIQLFQRSYLVHHQH